MIKLSILILVFLIGFFGNLQADTIFLKNGRRIEGFIKKEGQNSIELDVGFGMVKFKRDEIVRIYRSTPEESAEIYQKWEKRKQEAEKIRLEKDREPRYVEIEQKNGHIVVDAILNGKVHALLFLDTGASVVVLTSKVAKDLGLNLDSIKANIQLQLADGRKINAKYMILETVKVQGVEAKRVETAILPDDVGGTGFKDGLLGMSFLRRFNFRIDQENKKLILEKLI